MDRKLKIKQLSRISFLFLLFTSLLILLCSCAKEEVKKVVKKKVVAPKTTIKVVEKKKKIKYRYTGSLYRDPFVSLADGKIVSPVLKTEGEGKMPSLGTLSLKGIMFDSRTRIALLSSPRGNYILKNGKLYDNRNRIVNGLTGVIYEKSVKLTTEDNFVRNLKLREIQ